MGKILAFPQKKTSTLIRLTEDNVLNEVTFSIQPSPPGVYQIVSEVFPISKALIVCEQGKALESDLPIGWAAYFTVAVAGFARVQNFVAQVEAILPDRYLFKKIPEL